MHISNKKAYYEFFILKEYIAGMVLLGTEVKSLLNSDASITEAYIYINNGEVFIKGMHIAKWKSSLITNHDEIRERKLLLNKKEINEIIEETKNVGITLIPIELFIKNRKIKIKIGLAKGKKLHDKRNSIREKEVKRELSKLKY